MYFALRVAFIRSSGHHSEACSGDCGMVLRQSGRLNKGKREVSHIRIDHLYHVSS